MNATLSQWEVSQAARLSELRASVEDREMLLRLLETSCMLELSRLACAQPGLAVYARMGLEVLCEFFPVESCTLAIDVPGLAPVRASHGKPPFRLPAAPVELVLRAAGEPVGILRLAGDLGGASPSVLGAVADQLSSALGAVVAAEQLRRKAGAADAHQAASQFSSGPDSTRLEQLTAALGRLPGVLGAEVSGVAVVGGDAEPRRAGLVGSGPQTDHLVSGDDGLLIRISLTWEYEPEDDDNTLVDEVLASLSAAIATWDEQRRLRHEAETDPLTGLANRRRAARELTAALSRAERFSEPVAVLALDLDHFKSVNDTLGHDAGDAVLQAVAAALRVAIRGYDLAARMGGEEFLVVCPAATPEAAQIVASRLLAAIPEACEPVLPPGWRQTTSVGIANHPQHGQNAAELLRAADDALYAAKRGGRDKWSVPETPAAQHARR